MSPGHFALSQSSRALKREDARSCAKNHGEKKKETETARVRVYV